MDAAHAEREAVNELALFALRGLGRVLGDLAEMGFDAEWLMASVVPIDLPKALCIMNFAQ